MISQAADVTWGTDADVIIPRVVAGTLSLLNSAAQTASVKSLVLTSSSSAVLLPQPNVEGLVVDESEMRAVNGHWYQRSTDRQIQISGTMRRSNSHIPRTCQTET